MADMSISAEITADGKKFDAEIKRCQKTLSNFGKSLGEATNKVSKGLKGWGVDFEKFYSTGSGFLENFGISLDKFAGKLGASGPVVAAIATATVALTKLGQEFNSAMAEIAKGTGATGEALAEFNGNLQNLMISGVGSSMADIATNIADVNTRFGATGEELETLVDQFDQFAGVTGQNVHQAVNDVADVINKWGMEAKDIKPLLDQLTKAGQDSGVSVQFLTQTLTQSKTVFTQFGMSATTSIAFVEQLAKAGVDTNTAMTGMRYALAKFSAEGKNSQKAFAEIGDAIRNAETDSEALTIALEAFGSKAGAEMINVFRNGKYSIDDFTEALRSAGGVVEATDNATKTSADAMDELMNTLKGMTSGFGQGFDVIFRDLLNSLQMVVGAIAPIIQPLGNIFRDVAIAVGSAVKEIVSFVVELHKRVDIGFKAVVSVLNYVYKVTHENLDNVVSVFQDAFGFIFAILEGKWALAWEYAKNAMLKVCDGILNTLSTWLNLMKEPVNGFIKYVINPLIDAWNFLHILTEDKVDKIEPIRDIDLSGLTNLTSAITESDKKIAELTGKTTKQIIGDLGKVKDVATDVTTSIENSASSSLKTVSQWEQKLIQQEIERLKREKENSVIKAENEKKSEKEIYDIKKGYDDKIIALQIQKLELDKKAALEQITDAKEIERVNKYYENEILALKEKNVERIKEIQEQASQWGTKLLAQRISMLEQEESLAIEKARSQEKSESEIYKISKHYGELILAEKTKQIEAQKAADLASVTAPAERAKIIQFYENQLTYITIQETEKRKEKHTEITNSEIKEDRNKYSEMIANATSYAKSTLGILQKLSKNIANVFSKIKSVATKAFTAMKDIAIKAFNGIKTGVKTVTNAFNTLFSFDADEALDNLLIYEDKILTFFLFAKTKIPQFVESAFTSVDNLTGRLVSIVKVEDIQTALDSIINTVVTYAPTILENIITVFGRVVEGVANSLVNNSPRIASAFGQMLGTVLTNLPSIAKNILTALSTLAVNIADEIVNRAPQMEAAISQLISIVVQHLPIILKSLITVGATIITTIADAMVANSDGIVKAIGDVVMSILDNLPTVLKSVLTVILTLITGIADYINNNADEFINAIVEVVTAVVDAIVNFVENGGIKKVLDAIIVITKAINKAIEDNLPDIVDAIIDVLPDIVDAIIELIKEINKTSKKIIEPLMKLIVALIDAVLEILLSPDVIESAIEVLGKLIEAIISQLLPKLPGFIIQIWLFIIELWFKYLPKLVVEIVKGLVNGFAKIDWKGMVKDIFSKFVKGIKNFFGIHSPSKMFEEFGTYMVQGLFNGLKNIWNKVKNIFSNLAKNISNVFTGIFSNVSNIIGNLSSNISNVFSNISENVKTAVSNIGSSITNAFLSVLNSVKDIFNNIASSISGVFDNIVSGTGGFVKKFMNALGGVGSAVGNAATSAWNTITNGISGLASTIGDSMAKGIKNGVNTAIRGINSLLGKVEDVIQIPGFSYKKSLPWPLPDINISIPGSGQLIWLPRIPEFAIGTPNAQKGLSIVGEKGPELVDFRGGEKVYNNHNTEKMLANAGSKSYSFITFNNTSQTTAFTIMRELKKYNRELAFNGVL